MKKLIGRFKLANIGDVSLVLGMEVASDREQKTL